MPGSTRGWRILGYHLVGAGTGLPLDLPVASFRVHLAEVRRRATATDLIEGARRLRENGGRDEPLVTVTFDDAYENFYTDCWPHLVEHAVPATLFVPVGFIEGESPAPTATATPLRPMSWSQLREVVRSGLVTVGSHSWTHPDLRQLGRSALERELRDSRRKLEDELDTAVDAFAYPRALWSRSVEAQVGEVYAYAALAGGRRITSGNLDPMRLWRVPIRSEMDGSLAGVLASRVWIEEWIADAVRRSALQRLTGRAR